MTTPTAALVAYKERRMLGRPRVLKHWYQNRSLVAGMIIVGLLVLVAVFAPWIAPYDPIKQDLTNSLQSPNAAHWLGTDKYGRDVLSRLVWGARVDLRVG